MDESNPQFNKCDVCGVQDKSVELQVSRSQMVFGGFRGKMHEYRCKDCEKNVSKLITKLLKNMHKHNKC